MRTSGELGYPTPTCTALLGNGNQRASPNLRAPCRFFFGIAQRKSLAKRKARENALFNLTSNIDECAVRFKQMHVCAHLVAIERKRAARAYDSIKALSVSILTGTPRAPHVTTCDRVVESIEQPWPMGVLPAIPQTCSVLVSMD